MILHFIIVPGRNLLTGFGSGHLLAVFVPMTSVSWGGMSLGGEDVHGRDWYSMLGQSPYPDRQEGLEISPTGINL